MSTPTKPRSDRSGGHDRGGPGGGGKRRYIRKKFCRFCAEKELQLDYKNVYLIKQFISERYQVNYPFILYAGAIRPHKNVVRIIEAFSALKNQLEKEAQYPDLKLIVIGDDLSSHPRLRRRAKSPRYH